MAKRKTKKKIIAGIASSVVLVSGATAGILCTSEMEVENKEEKEKKRKVSIKTINQPIARNSINGQQDLATILPDSQRNLGNIVINQGNEFVVKQIEDNLIKKNIDTSQVEVIKIRLKTAIIKPLVGSTIYGGNPIVVHFNSDDRQVLSWIVSDWQRNLGTLITDGTVKPTAEQIKAELAKLQVNTSQVEIINIESTKAIINPIADSVAYRGNAITVFFSVDSRQDLTTLLLGSQNNLGTIITTNGSRPTVGQVKEKLAKKGIDTSQLEIINIENTTVSIKPIANSTKYKGKLITMYFKIANNSQDLTTLLPIWQRNLGKVYIGQMPVVDQQKSISAIADMLSNKYNIDVNEIAIKIDSSQSQAVISSLNNHIYTGSVTLNYQLDTSFVTLDYLVPNLHSRKQQVASYYCQNHEDIINAKNDILSDDEFKNLPEVNNFINELNEKVKYKANNEASNAFTRIENNNDNFKDFEDLKQQVYQHHNSFNGKINLDDFVNTITNYYQQIDVNPKINQLKTAMCRFYNILAQVYGKDNILRMLQKIELDQQFYENSSQKFVRTSIFGFL